MSEERKADGTAPCGCEGLLERTKRLLAEAATDWIKRPIAEMGAWLRRKILSFALGLVLLSVAAIFLMIGTMLGLEVLRVPFWASYLIVGGLAAVAGAILIFRK